MARFQTLATTALAVTIGSLIVTAAHAQASPVGTWMDHTGRGAVEIIDCDGKLCGNIVAVDKKDQAVCGLQVIGAVKAKSAGRWDGGWIYDPEDEAKYDLEIVQLDDNRLKITGYEGVKLFGESFIWTRAAPTLPRCKA
jgi:uncharacterized protein (DUF2147 family)